MLRKELKGGENVHRHSQYFSFVTVCYSPQVNSPANYHRFKMTDYLARDNGGNLSLPTFLSLSFCLPTPLLSLWSIQVCVHVCTGTCALRV